MADCNSIESLLDELLDKLNNSSNCCDELQPLIFQIQKDILGLKDATRIQRIKLERLIIEFTNFKKSQTDDKTIPARLRRAEQQIKAQIAFTAKLNSFAKKTDNDFRFAVKRFTQRFADITKKFSQQDTKNKQLDNKNKVQDKKNSDQDTAISVLQAAVAGLLALGAKLAALIAKQKATDIALDGLKRISQGQKGQKGDKGDRGDRGQRGDKGDRGDNGQKGNTGDRGSQGNTGAKGETGSQGQKGAKGDRGDTGSQGQKGDRGETGLKGDKGDRGSNGTNGAKGDRGATGLKGEKGDEGMVKIVKVPEIVKQTEIVKVPQIVERIKEVTKTVIVYKEPNLSQLLAKIAELRSRLIFGSSVEIPASCSESSIVPTTDLPTFLNALEDKLSAIEKLICEKEEIEAYNLGTFSETTTVNLQAETRFIKITVTGFPDGITRRFGRTTNQPDNYRFGNVAFESSLGLSPEIDWEWIESYFYPDKENDPNKIHIYTANLNTTYTITGYKVKL